jgi:dsDNA-specific endonuclease/ATPase MutS2
VLGRLRSLLARLFEAAPAPAPPEPEPEQPPPGEDDIAVLPIEDSIDLHGFQPRDIPSVVEEYLREAHARGFTEVRLIHGRGKGVQRRVVQSILAKHPLVESFRDAPASRGGWGATLAVFKREA